MSYAQRMLASSPSRVPEVPVETLAACVAACFDCSQACTTCADACLGERDAQRLESLARCIRLNAHCADMCITTGRLLSRQEMPALARARPGRVVYVSCNPAALGRDARVLAQAGFRLVEATPVDQFLWSAQIEAVAVFAPG